ncbi:MAG: hypothetical protein WC756_14535 [Taibaiella sp.]|jgi:hypothetical protein
MHAVYMRVIVPALIILPIIVAISRRKYWGLPEKAILVYLLISAFFNTLATFLSARGINNLPLLHLYTVLEFISVTSFFYFSTNRKKDKQVIKVLWFAFPLLTIANVVYLNSIYLYNLIPRSTEAIIILILCINFLMRSLSFSADRVPFFAFAVVVALLLYFSGSLTLFALSDFIIANKTINLLIWNTHATFVLIMYLIIAVAYFKTDKDK